VSLGGAAAALLVAAEVEDAEAMALSAAWSAGVETRAARGVDSVPCRGVRAGWLYTRRDKTRRSVAACVWVFFFLKKCLGFG
jgi:hypothetical protein